jgi:hypothetical protein
MRWKEKPRFNNGDRRLRTAFLFFPKTINGETRWLETASWIEKYFMWEDFPRLPHEWVREMA